MSVGVPSTSRNVGNKTRKLPVTVTYEGKASEDEVLKGTFDQYNWIGDVNPSVQTKDPDSFYFGDNLDVMRYLLNQGYQQQVRLVYIDPPFATNSVFLNREQQQSYSDHLDGAEFVEFLRQRLILIRELLASDGALYLHLDQKMAFTMKLILNELFGAENCRAFITRKKCSTKNSTTRTFGNISDYIMFYSKSSNYVWNRPFEPWEYDRMIEQYPYVDDNGRRYKKVPLHAPGVRNGETGKEWKGLLPPPGKHWQYQPEKLDEMDAAGEIYWSPNGNPRRKVFCDPDKGIPVQDIWLNFRDSINQAQKTTGYPTEKNLEMLKLIVKASTNEGDLVMDCFAGSGTTLDAAFSCGRKWLGIDNSPESLKAVIKRF